MDIKNKKVLVAYFSHAGEVYMNGVLKHIEIGNTKVVAQVISEMTNGELYFIDTVKQYPSRYMEKIDVAKKELEKKARPELKTHFQILDKYDIIFLCYPNWWSTCPMAVFTFLEEKDFTDKVIIPLCTHEGSGLGKSVQDIKATCPSSTVLAGLAIPGSKAHVSNDIIVDWIKGL